jgi:hypothetical protein
MVRHSAERKLWAAKYIMLIDIDKGHISRHGLQSPKTGDFVVHPVVTREIAASSRAASD